MEKRKESLCTEKVCRFCLTQDNLKSLYDKKQASAKSVPLSLKILSNVSIEVFPSDRMPSFICKRCSFYMDIFFDFKKICRDADETILQYIQKGTNLEPIFWPPALVKLSNYGFRYTSSSGVMKTVVEGGATVEVTSQDISDSEDDENVYNVKVGDGSEEGTSACVKVVTSKDEGGTPKGKSKKELELNIKAEDGNVTAANMSDGCWPCNECDCTYPLQQLLELHKKHKHRVRTVACDQCDAKFYTKYDLATHQLRHLDVLPFTCPACGQKFRRLPLLKRHERDVHKDIPQKKCPYCPSSFLTLTEWKAHQQRHLRPGNNLLKPFECDICHNKFREKHSLVRHKQLIHDNKPTLRCEYCPERFASVSKLARHVRTHAGDRPYPCKYCDKSFIKSHHYTRHLRVKHREEFRSQQETNSEEYRCEQCLEAFTSQDDLMYHSAIHATQNLTCPLCQEKFDDIDSVTSHIKSHVNGMEFMCDLCELVFTTKDKLDNHLVAAHEDEICSQVLEQDESSMEMEAEEDDDENSINVKDEGDHMLVEIKKPDEYMISNAQAESEDKMNNTNSEESEEECGDVGDMPLLSDSPVTIKKTGPAVMKASVAEPAGDVPAVAVPIPAAPAAATPQLKPGNERTNMPPVILRKADEIKRKMYHCTPDTGVQEKKPKPGGTSSTGGASDKSLRLLEKELQELQRTNTRNDSTKASAKSVESLRSRGRPQMHTSTPKLRTTEEKKSQIVAKSTSLEKKIPERRAIKENKKPEESKEIKTINSNLKEDKEPKAKESQEEKVKTVNNKEEKNVLKNGSSSKSSLEDQVRRSSRPSKVKDYAKMVRDRSPSDDDDSDDDDEEYVEAEKSEFRPKTRRGSLKTQAKVQVQPQAQPQPQQAKAAAPARKRGRPRKEPIKEAVPAKVKKSQSEDSEGNPEKMDAEPELNSTSPEKADDQDEGNDSADASTSLNKTEEKPNLIVAPTGHTLKKVPIKALPPGVKPLPLPINARSMGPGELCEMQIGKKVVKVQKIVMTKAEVEAMAKKGLVEMKDGTMVLKQGIKIPTDPIAIKSTLVGEGRSD
ncbi:RE1-silencing transcription factor-like isoform X2 [Pectinophora gossypiella]|uniref:RE1-silencing transcription factor-like isoform X2 n=1 Tax=Pectinophora gossypiella TaxID=13191 RepID=UPI00214F5E91|nr:RE1-silencing transcription factor-like isoform X2 [Pectinophora gossypiella]